VEYSSGAFGGRVEKTVTPDELLPFLVVAKQSAANKAEPDPGGYPMAEIYHRPHTRACFRRVFSFKLPLSTRDENFH
jgi:hypothetical protein